MGRAARRTGGPGAGTVSHVGNASAADEVMALARAEAAGGGGGAVRRARAAVLAQAAGLQPAALAAAAFVLLWGDARDVALALELAQRAMGGHRPAGRLAAAAFDRQRQCEGRPQKFGLWPGEVAPGTTDSERAKWGVPPMAELRRTALAAADGEAGTAWLRAWLAAALG